MNANDRFIRNARLIGIALGGLYVVRYLRTWSEPDSWTILDDVDLAIHEAGHMVFMPFGEFMMVLGGSLFQLLIPAAFVGYFARRRDWYSTFFVMLWLGQSCFNVSYYIADARVRELPLITGDPSTHDWTWLLLQMNLLYQDVVLGGIVRIIGTLLLVTAVVGCVKVALYQPPEPLKSFASTKPLVARDSVS